MLNREIAAPTRTKNILTKKNINTADDLLHYFPRKYNNFTDLYKRVNPDLDGRTGCFIGTLESISKSQTASKCSCVKFKLIMEDGNKISVTIFGQCFMENKLLPMEKKQIAVCGTLQYSEIYGFGISNPDHIEYSSKLRTIARIEPIYTHIKGISEETFADLMDKAIMECSDDPVITRELLIKYDLGNLPSLKEAYHTIHHPTTMDIQAAQDRINFNDMLTYAIEIEKKGRASSKGTHVAIKSTKVVRDIIKNLPYELTADQQKCYEKMLANLREGKRVSCLIQGDVGCGKTLIAELILFLMAENGYQGVLMAPTAILASQHYQEICSIAQRYGIHSAYLDGAVPASEKKKILADISAGRIQILIGTHAIVSGKINYHRLGVVIIDEEHRFGVKQRDVLLKEAENGVNSISMSATPMPRTLASTIHGGIDVFDIRTMPACRIPVQTAINNSDQRIFDWIGKQLHMGHQAYVVCPLIEENTDARAMEGIQSVEQAYEIYKKRFSGYTVAMLNGDMSESEKISTIMAFKEGSVHILISTTVIEVGVNVPNASVIVISNAERFGLATMHQLRGRVGRGNDKGYCILKSTEKNNPRLNIMVNCCDGFSIAEEDMKLRGAGDIVGIKQSGSIRYMDLIQLNPIMYEKARQIAVELVDEM